MALQCGVNDIGWQTGQVKEAIAFTANQSLDLAKSVAQSASFASAVAWMRGLPECPQTAEPPERPCKYKWNEPKYKPAEVVAQPARFTQRIRIFGFIPVASLTLWKASARVDWKVTTHCLREGDLPPGWGQF